MKKKKSKGLVLTWGGEGRGEWMKKLSFYCCFEVLEKVHAVDKEQHMSGMQWSGKRCSTGGWRVVVANKMYTERTFFFFFFFGNPVVWFWLGHWGAVSG
jgi:hypothetical protein